MTSKQWANYTRSFWFILYGMMLPRRMSSLKNSSRFAAELKGWHQTGKWRMHSRPCDLAWPEWRSPSSRLQWLSQMRGQEMMDGGPHERSITVGRTLWPPVCLWVRLKKGLTNMKRDIGGGSTPPTRQKISLPGASTLLSNFWPTVAQASDQLTWMSLTCPQPLPLYIVQNVRGQAAVLMLALLFLKDYRKQMYFRSHPLLLSIPFLVKIQKESPSCCFKYSSYI